MADYFKVEVTIEFTKESLASTTADGVSFLFEQDAVGNIVLPAIYWRSMLKKAIEIFMPDRLYLINRILPDVLRQSPARIDLITEGTQTYQALPIGARLTTHFVVPSLIPLDEFKHLLGQAGHWVGFSPAKAHLGYGRFMLVGYEELPLE